MANPRGWQKADSHPFIIRLTGINIYMKQAKCYPHGKQGVECSKYFFVSDIRNFRFATT